MVDIERLKESIKFTATGFTVALVIIAFTLFQARMISNITGIPLKNEYATLSFPAILSVVLTGLELKLLIDIPIIKGLEEAKQEERMINDE